MRGLFLLLLLAAGQFLFAQVADNRFTDSIKKRVAAAASVKDKVTDMMTLAFATPDSLQAEVYAGQAIADAEMSRDRWLIAMSYIRNGARYLNNAGLEANLKKAEAAFERGERVARESGLTQLLVQSETYLAQVWRVRGNNERALAYSNQAHGAAINSDNDTAKVAAGVSLGESYMNMKQMPESFENLAEARTIADESKDEMLRRDVYIGFTHFYRQMHEFEKAVDFGERAFEASRRVGNGMNELVDLYRLGDLFAANKQQDLALKMYERSNALADTMRYQFFKINTYFRIFSMYYSTNQYQKGYQYLMVHPEMLYYLEHLGYGFYLWELKAIAFADEGREDSARYYFQLAGPAIEARGNLEMRYEFNQSIGDYHRKRKDYAGAIAAYKKAFDLVAGNVDPEAEVEVADTLRSLYERVGDFRSAYMYNQRSIAAQDSIRAQTHETELMKLEVDTDNRRRERAAREEEVSTERRHNIQYMGFTAGLVLLFITIVLLGHLTVPVSVIRTVVFLSFIFLFEFIILLLDRTIAEWTHEEPWKVLLIKIVLAAGLVPLHHWLEHRVIHYLSHRRHVLPVAAEKGDII
jgi:tetratricopeptide (TPR) repeat protein